MSDWWKRIDNHINEEERKKEEQKKLQELREKQEAEHVWNNLLKEHQAAIAFSA